MKRIILQDMSDELTNEMQGNKTPSWFWSYCGTINSIFEGLEPNKDVAKVISCYEVRKNFYKITIEHTEILTVKVIFDDQYKFERTEVKSLDEEILSKDDFISLVNNAYKNRIDLYDTKVDKYNTDFQNAFGISIEKAKEISDMYERCDYEIKSYLSKRNKI